MFLAAALLALVLFGLTARTLLQGVAAVTGGRPASAPPPSAGGAVTDLHQVGTSTTSVTLTWVPVPGGAPYAIYRGGMRIASTRLHAFTDRRLPGPGTYRYSVIDRYGKRTRITAQAALPWPAVEALAARSVALVTTYPTNVSLLTGRVIGGAGFVVSQGCDILTAYHVVRGAHPLIDVHLPSDAQVRAQVLATDPAQDLALLELPRGTRCGAPLPFASHTPAIGAPVGLLGHPALGALVFARGAISGRAETVDVKTLGLFKEFPFRGAVDPGDSGGPLLNHWGQVVGVVDARGGAKIGYALIASQAAAFVQRYVGGPT